MTGLQIVRRYTFPNGARAAVFNDGRVSLRLACNPVSVKCSRAALAAAIRKARHHPATRTVRGGWRRWPLVSHGD